ncbi:amidohydrolase [Chloroflexota bacterium]
MPVADLILKNANVVTVDQNHPNARLVAVKRDTIVLVTDNSDGLQSISGAKTKIIDCQGKTVVPGFNDAHCHIFSYIRKLLSIDLSPSSVSSISNIKATIRQKVQNTPFGQGFIGTDYNDFYLSERRHPNRWDIDKVAPHHPVILSHRSLHACVLNSLALSLANITKETPAPPGGFIDRDPNSGEPTGLLFEMLGHIREKVMPPISEEELTNGITSANRHYLSQGITSLQDATAVNDSKRWQYFNQFKDADRLKSRVCMMTGIKGLIQFREAGLTSGYGNSHLRLGALKLLPSESTGHLYPPQSELNQQVFDAHRAGFQLAIHAIQQSTVEAAIIALEYACRLLPKSDHRHRIEHCSECPPHLLNRLKKLQALVVTQPPFLYHSGKRYLVTVPTEQLRWLYRIKSFLNSGLIVAGSSDSPIVPNNPLDGIFAAVTRQAKSGQQLLPQECISASQALAMYTINAAYATFEEGIKGSITQGKLADIVLLSDDPTTTPPENIKDIKVEMTIIGGDVVWEA